MKLILLLTCIIAISQSTSTTSRYVLSVIEHLTATETGVRNCVFYGLRPDSALEEVLRAPQLTFTPKLIYTVRRYRPVDKDRLPTEHLLFMVDGAKIESRVNQILAVLNTTNPCNKVLVLVDTISSDYRICQQLFRRWSFSNVVYLDEKRRRMYLADTVKRVRVGYLAPPSELYNGSMMRSMQGRTVTFAQRSSGSTLNADLRWLEETASFMNTSVRESRHKCSELYMKVQDDCYLDHVRDKKVDVDLSDYQVNGIRPRTFWMLCIGVSNGKVILVPRSQLTITQLFTFPLNWEVWILLVVLLGVLEMIKLLFPTLLRNDPVLLAVCGFQQYDLNKTEQWEKMILLPAIVLLFFISCAYETKLLSMMISKPATQQIDTLAELVQSGIKVKLNFLQSPGMINDSVLGPIFVNSTESVNVMDKIHAYVTKLDMANYVLPLYYDQKQRINRYAIMDETFGTWPKVFMLSLRNPFLTILGYTYITFVESGIMTYWNTYLTHIIDKHMAVNTNSNNSLHFVDLIPAWIIFGFGLLLSTALLGCEAMLYQILQRYNNRLVSGTVPKSSDQQNRRSNIQVPTLFKDVPSMGLNKIYY